MARKKKPNNKGSPNVIARDLFALKGRMNVLETIVSVNDEAYPLTEGTKTMSISAVLALELGIPSEQHEAFKAWLKTAFDAYMES